MRKKQVMDRNIRERYSSPWRSDEYTKDQNDQRTGGSKRHEQASGRFTADLNRYSHYNGGGLYSSSQCKDSLSPSRHTNRCAPLELSNSPSPIRRASRYSPSQLRNSPLSSRRASRYSPSQRSPQPSQVDGYSHAVLNIQPSGEGFRSHTQTSGRLRETGISNYSSSNLENDSKYIGGNRYSPSESWNSYQARGAIHFPSEMRNSPSSSHRVSRNSLFEIRNGRSPSRRVSRYSPSKMRDNPSPSHRVSRYSLSEIRNGRSPSGRVLRYSPSVMRNCRSPIGRVSRYSPSDLISLSRYSPSEERKNFSNGRLHACGSRQEIQTGSSRVIKDKDTFLNPMKPPKRGKSSSEAREFIVARKARQLGQAINRRCSIPLGFKQRKPCVEGAPDACKAYLTKSGTVRIAIVAKNHPDRVLSKEEQTKLADAIASEIKNSNKKDNICFKSITLRPGILLFICGNVSSAIWLESVIPTLEWKGPKLKICFGYDIPRAHTIQIVLTRTDNIDDTEVLKVLANQNLNLNVELWRIHQSRREGSTCIFVFGIDEQSFLKLDKQNLEIKYRFSVVKVQVFK